MLTTQKQIEKVVQLREEENMSFSQIAAELGFSERTARRRYEAASTPSMGFPFDPMLKAEDLPKDENNFPIDDPAPDIKVKGPFVPAGSKKIERFKPLTRTGNVMVTADYHIPLHDSDMINTMINCARKNDIKSLIIAGDFWNMDSFSSYLPHQPEASWEIERYEGNYIMKTLLKTFDEVDFIWGNHDFRLSRVTGFKHSFQDCMKWALNALTEEEMSKVRFSDLDYMFYNCEVTGRTFRVCHPQNFSKVPLTVPRNLAVKYGTGIISAHSHHCSMGAAANGKDLIMEAGGFFDKERTEYIQRTTSHHEWVQGFIMFKDGKPEVISPAFMNHTEYLKEVK